ncbi:MAG: hypothetical protein ACSHYF_09425 [Verrucomicrobiaceae bacterium]
MALFKDPRRHTAAEAEDFAYPPNGGNLKLILLGIILPLVIFYFARQAWVTEEAVWFGRRHDVTIQGDAAKWMSLAYASVGGFCFSRWCLGIIASYRLFELGTILSILSFIISLIMAGAYALEG